MDTQFSIRTYYLNKMAINFSRCKLTIIGGVAEVFLAGKDTVRQLLTATRGIPPAAERPLFQLTMARNQRALICTKTINNPGDGAEKSTEWGDFQRRSVAKRKEGLAGFGQRRYSGNHAKSKQTPPLWPSRSNQHSPISLPLLARLN